LTAADQGDYELVSAIFRPDVHWINDIGAGPYREAHGIEEVFTLLGQWNGLFEGTFHEEIIDVCGSDDNVVAILHETGSVNGHQFDNLAFFRFELDAEGRGPSGEREHVRPRPGGNRTLLGCRRSWIDVMCPSRRDSARHSRIATNERWIGRIPDVAVTV